MTGLKYRDEQAGRGCCSGQSFSHQVGYVSSTIAIWSEAYQVWSWQVSPPAANQSWRRYRFLLTALLFIRAILS